MGLRLQSAMMADLWWCMSGTWIEYIESFFEGFFESDKFRLLDRIGLIIPRTNQNGLILVLVIIILFISMCKFQYLCQ